MDNTYNKSVKFVLPKFFNEILIQNSTKLYLHVSKHYFISNNFRDPNNSFLNSELQFFSYIRFKLDRIARLLNSRFLDICNTMPYLWFSVTQRSRSDTFLDLNLLSFWLHENPCSAFGSTVTFGHISDVTETYAKQSS